MANLRTLGPLLLGLASSCGGSVGDERVSEPPGDERGSVGGGDDRGNGATTGEGESPPPVPTCKRRCVAPEDCARSGKSRDADNWECQDDACVFIGCRTDDECIQDWGPTKRCAQHYSGVPDCLEACVTENDCDHSTDPRFYECRESLCQFVGCADDAQCGAIRPHTVCDETASPPQCVPGCNASSECRRRVSDDSGPLLISRWHYEEGECIDSVCTYAEPAGCSETGECRQGLVCR